MIDDLANEHVPQLPGYPITPDRLGRVADALNRQQSRITIPQQVIPQMRVKAGAGVAADVAWFQVLSIHFTDDGETVRCRMWDIETGVYIPGSDAHVALPKALRRSTWNGVRIGSYSLSTRFLWQERLSTRLGSTTDTEIQRIVEPYRGPTFFYTGDIIHAIRAETGIDGVEWQDLNEDGKAWARKYGQ